MLWKKQLGWSQVVIMRCLCPFFRSEPSAVVEGWLGIFHLAVSRVENLLESIEDRVITLVLNRLSLLFPLGVRVLDVLNFDLIARAGEEPTLLLG